MLSLMGMRNELLQTLWEVIAEMERACLQGNDDMAQRLELIAWRLVGVLGRHLSGKADSNIRKH